MKIGVIVAMESEYEALLNAGVENVVKAGIGKVNAARATAELILTCLLYTSPSPRDA